MASFFFCSLKRQKSKSSLQYGSNIDAIPSKPILPWRGDICAAYTGPNTGLTSLELDTKLPKPSSEAAVAVAGCHNWNNPQEYAYGLALSLYEEDVKKTTAIAATTTSGDGTERGCSRSPCCIVGDPIADVFGIQTRENSCVMALADGVSWGLKSRLAARCATHAVMEHITSNFSRIQSSPSSSTVFQLLHEAVTVKAQELILKHHATLTTLSCAVVCEMKTPGEWGLFVCAVGDSQVYIYCPHTQKVVEATIGCHPSGGSRDLRNAGGVLGPSLGPSPDLANLSYAFLPVYRGDIVFAVSDGVSDNFSNKVISSFTGEKAIQPPQKVSVKSCCESSPNLTQVLNQHQDSMGEDMSAQSVAACLVNHSVEVTEKKRLLCTHCLTEGIDMRREAARNPEFAARVNAAAGKLDHATAVAYQVGHHHPC